MDVEHQHRLTLKILIGSAWVDQSLEPEEIQYLGTLLRRYQLDHDQELLDLLQAPISLEQTERWMIAYLQGTTNEERLKLLADIGRIVIADNVVTDSEHDLLDEYHELMAQIPAHPDVSRPRSTTVGGRDYGGAATHAEAAACSDQSSASTLVQTVGKFVRRAIQVLGNLASGS